MKYIILFVTVLFLVKNYSFAQDTFWTDGSKGGDWGNASTWYQIGSGDLDGIPDADDNVRIGDGASVNVTGTETCKSLIFGDASSAAFFTINSGGTLSITTDFTIKDSADGAIMFTSIEGTLNVGGKLLVASSNTAYTNYYDITIGSAGVMNINGSTTNKIQIRNNSADIYLNVSGTLNSNATFALVALSSAIITCNIESTGTINAASWSQTLLLGTTCAINTNVNGGVLDIGTDLSFQGNIPANNILDMDKSNDPQVFCGRDIINPTKGTINNGTNPSTFTFDGSGNASIPVNSTITFYNLALSGTRAGSLGGAMPASQLLGNLSTGSTSSFSTNSFSCDVTGNVSNFGTLTVNAPLTVGGNISSTGSISASDNIDANGNITNIGTYTSTGSDINIAGNWNNPGTYNYSTGDTVTFDGTSGSQSISGNTDWYDLAVNHSGSGVSFSSGTHNINHIFNIDAGAVTNSSASVVLVSNASGTAQMDNIDAGSYTGNLTVQRYINKTSQGNVSIGTAVQGQTLNSLHDGGIGAGQEFILSGFPNSDYPSFSYNNVSTYNEATAGARSNGWTGATDISDGFGQAPGYKAAYVYADAATFNISMTGTPNTGSIPVSITRSGATDEDGWNLISNPLPCTVDWESISHSNIWNGFLVYSDDVGNYAYYESPGPGINGADRYIPSSQGIWVYATASSPSITFAESDKNPNQDATFLKSSNNLETLKISFAGNVNQYSDEALLIANEDYKNNFDQNDMIKWRTPDSLQSPTLSTLSLDGYELAFNRINSGQSFDVPIIAKPGRNAQGVYHLDFTIPNDFMGGACLVLEDLKTGNTTDLLVDTSYSFTTADTDVSPRFVLHISKGVNSYVSNLSCAGNNDGKIVLTGSGISGNNFTIIDENNIEIFNGIAVNDSVSVYNLSEGNYTVSTNFANSCSTGGDKTINIIAPMEVVSNFELIKDTIYLNSQEIGEFINNSSGSTYSWDFGDGTSSSEMTPSHTYTTPGIYQIMLTVSNDGNCAETTSKNIVVMSTPLSIEENNQENFINAFVTNERLMINFDLTSESDVLIDLVDVSGKTILNNINRRVSNNQIELTQTDMLSKGLYFVTITLDDKKIVKTVSIN